MDIQLTDEKVIVLPAVMTIAEAEAFHGFLDQAMQAGDVHRIDASNVDRIDTSIVQQLLLYVREMEKAHIDIEWLGKSEAFSSAVSLLGLGKVFNVH